MAPSESLHPTARVDVLLRGYCKGLEVLMVGCVLLMVALVFGNVVLRYGFNSGIAVSEEISRWLFVWLTFLGGIVALREHAHLGTEVLVGRLGSTGKKACLLLGYALMLLCCWLLLRGSIAQMRVNWDTAAPSSGLSVAIFYAVGVVFSVSAAAILLNDLAKLLSGRVADSDLIIVKESEDQA